MGERMRKRKHLHGLRIRAVDEHERGTRIGERKAAKFVGIEPAVAVVADNAVDHYQDAKGISLIDATAQRLLPTRDFPALLQLEPKRAPHGRRGRTDVAS